MRSLILCMRCSAHAHHKCTILLFFKLFYCFSVQFFTVLVGYIFSTACEKGLKRDPFSPIEKKRDAVTVSRSGSMSRLLPFSKCFICKQIISQSNKTEECSSKCRALCKVSNGARSFYDQCILYAYC